MLKLDISLIYALYAHFYFDVLMDAITIRKTYIFRTISLHEKANSDSDQECERKFLDSVELDYFAWPVPYCSTPLPFVLSFRGWWWIIRNPKIDLHKTKIVRKVPPLVPRLWCSCKCLWSLLLLSGCKNVNYVVGFCRRIGRRKNKSVPQGKLTFSVVVLQNKNVKPRSEYIIFSKWCGPSQQLLTSLWTVT